MDIQPASQSAYQAINQSQQRLDQAATDIAHAPIDTPVETTDSKKPSDTFAPVANKPIESSMVELQLAKTEAEAGTKILQADSERIGTLIDLEV